jgi:hypothetical protein
MMADRRRLILLVIAISVIGSTALFKYMTGSLLTISEDSRREVERYSIDFRRHDLSIPSLTASCKDIEDLHDRLVADTDFGVSPCFAEIRTAVGRSPKDSVVLMVFREWMRHAVYSESLDHNGILVKEVYSESSDKCDGQAQLVFERGDANDWLIVELRNLDRYMECACPTWITSQDR